MGSSLGIQRRLWTSSESTTCLTVKQTPIKREHVWGSGVAQGVAHCCERQCPRLQSPRLPLGPGSPSLMGNGSMPSGSELRAGHVCESGVSPRTDGFWFRGD